MSDHANVINDQEAHDAVGKSSRLLGLTLAAVTGVSAIAISVIAGPFVLPALRKICLPYVPATGKQVENVMKALEGRKGNVIDLGSGDGRLVFAAAKYGFHATGIELNPWLICYSKWKAWSLGVAENVKFYRQDLWTVDLGIYDNVVIFGVEEMMQPLQEKLSKEMCETCRVVACRFPFKNWKHSVIIGRGLDRVWIYNNGQNLEKSRK